MTPAEQERIAVAEAKAKYIKEQGMYPGSNIAYVDMPAEWKNQFNGDTINELYYWAQSHPGSDPAWAAQDFDNQYVTWAIKNNSPVFQEELARFQSGDMVGLDTHSAMNPTAWTSPFEPVFARAKSYFREGQFQPGAATATQPLLESALNQWARDAEPSGFDKFLDNALPSLIGGGLALATGLGPVVAGAVGGGASGASTGGEFSDILKGAVIGGASGYAAGQIPGFGAEAGAAGTSAFGSTAYPSLTDAAINTAVTGSGAGAAGVAVPGMVGSSITGATLANAGLGASGGLASLLNPASMPTAGIPAESSMFNSGYPSMTDSAVNTASGFGGTGATGSAVPSMYAPSMTEAALGAAGAGAAGASSLYPSLTNLANSTGGAGGASSDGAGGASSDGSWFDTAKSALGTGNTLSSLISGAASLYGAKQTADAAKEAAATNERFARESITGMQSANTLGNAEQLKQFDAGNAAQLEQFTSGNAARKNAFDTSNNALTNAYNTGVAGQNEQFNRGNEQLTNQFNAGTALQRPWYESGQTALTAQNDLMGLGVNGADGQLAALQNSPGYQFRLKQGQKSLDAGLAARGGMGSGKAATAASQYNQNYASNEYNNRLSQLSGVSNTGLQVGTNMANQGNAYANNMANRGTDFANAGASLGANYANNTARLNTDYGNNSATFGMDYANNRANRGTDYANTYANNLSNLAGNSANILSGLGAANANAGMVAANARQSGILGAGSALSDWLNPQPKTPTLADLLKGGNYGY